MNSVAQTGRISSHELDLALAHLQAGRLSEAESIYSHILEIEPNHFIALHHLGLIANSVGQYEVAIDLIRDALVIQPGHAPANMNLGIALKNHGDMVAAEDSFRMAQVLKPDYVLNNYNLGVLLQEQRRFEEAGACYDKVLACKPDFAAAWYSLGTTLLENGQVDEAMTCFEKTLVINPDFADAHKAMGFIFQQRSQSAEALTSYQKSLALKHCDALKISSRLLLPVIINSIDSLRETRKIFVSNIDNLLKESLFVENPNAFSSTNYFCLAYHGMNDSVLIKKQATLLAKSCPSLLYQSPYCIKTRESDKKKIRIGFVSKHLKIHTIGRLVEGVITNLSRELFDVVVFFYSTPSDEISKRIARRADTVVVITPTLEAARKSIQEQKLDILFYPDIGMEPFSYLLAFSRLAPVQCTTWGHPDTTGISTVDYFISHEDCEIEGSEAFYTERLVKLKSGVAYSYFYKPKFQKQAKSRADFGLDEHKTIYCCPQGFFKFHPDFDHALAGILRGDKNGVLVLLEGPEKHWQKLISDRLNKIMPDVWDRVIFLPPLAHQDYLALLCIADVVLDTFHFGGGLSSMEALAVGTPVVTLPGQFARGRYTYADYKRIGVMDCVASTPTEYVDIALGLGCDKFYNENVRKRISENIHYLFEDSGMVTELEKWFVSVVH